ncbi:hypothetical protein Ssi02_76550 [Sinosporangium siamense]|uniref:Uncharacterized protein n=1 Tax=Sinosporangium siamense TaxID=1367973 RepID=A0A919RRJ0_9ACTN|nr:hypothetical protein Ssi02_76550 [Sinosporangium siamense]
MRGGPEVRCAAGGMRCDDGVSVDKASDGAFHVCTAGAAPLPPRGEEAREGRDAFQGRLLSGFSCFPRRP